jgi:hypothetical protein
MPIDKLSGNSFSTGAIANSLGYTPANKAGDTFTGNVTVSGNLVVGSGSLVLQTGSQSNNSLALSLADDDTWVEQRKPDGNTVGRAGFNGYGANNAYYTDFDLYLRSISDTGLVRRMYINGATSATPNVEFSNVNTILRGGYRVWDAGIASGTVLQAQSAIKTDTQSSAAAGDTAISGLSVSITPRFASSKILIMYSVNYDSTRGNSGGGFRIFRNGSHLTGASGASAGNRYTVNADFGANYNADQSGMHRSGQMLDSPNTTSTLTYALYVYQDSSSYTTYINRARTDGNEGDDGRFASTITVLEIAG